MSFTEHAWNIFNKSVEDYHFDNVDFPINNPFENGSLEHLLYTKNWIDTVQWHFRRYH